MITTLITIGMGWYLYHFIEYGFHQLGHYNHPHNYVYLLHKKHHRDYPMTDFLSKTYRGRCEGLVAFFIPSLILTITLYQIFAYHTFKIVMGEIVCLAIVSDVIHTQIHTTNSWLERFEWFKESRRLHFIHHKRLTTNLSFAGLSHRADKTLGTYREKI